MWRRRRRSTWCVHPLSCRTGQSTCQSSVSLTTRGHSLTSDALTSAQRTIVLTLWQKYHQPYQPKDIVWCVHSVRLVGNKMPPGLCLFLIYSDSVDVFVSVLLKRSRHPRFAFQTLSKILAQKRDYDCDAAFTTNTAQMIIDESCTSLTPGDRRVFRFTCNTWTLTDYLRDVRSERRMTESEVQNILSQILFVFSKEQYESDCVSIWGFSEVVAF